MMFRRELRNHDACFFRSTIPVPRDLFRFRQFTPSYCVFDAVLEKLNAYITQKQLALNVHNYVVGLLTRSLGLLNYTEGTLTISM